MAKTLLYAAIIAAACSGGKLLNYGELLAGAMRRLAQSNARKSFGPQARTNKRAARSPRFKRQTQTKPTINDGRLGLMGLWLHK